MFEITINSVPIKDTSYIKDIHSINIRTLYNRRRIMMERAKARAITNYLYDACQRCTGAIFFNGVIIEKNKIIKPKI